MKTFMNSMLSTQHNVEATLLILYDTTCTYVIRNVKYEYYRRCHTHTVLSILSYVKEYRLLYRIIK